MLRLHLLSAVLVIVAEVASVSSAAEDAWVAVKRVHLPVSKFKILYNRLPNDAKQQDFAPNLDLVRRTMNGGKRNGDSLGWRNLANLREELDRNEMWLLHAMNHAEGRPAHAAPYV